jgi:hypothetical protein
MNHWQCGKHIMNIAMRNLTPRTGAKSNSGVGMTQNPPMPAPEVPDGITVVYEFVESILLPLPIADNDLTMVVNWWPQVSEDLFISPMWDGTIVSGLSQQVTPGEVADSNSKWTFTIPASFLVNHGRFPLIYVTSTFEDGEINPVESTPAWVLVDRVAPGGEELPMLEIDTLNGDSVITAADLNVNDELEATIADYYEMKEFDLVTPWIGLSDGSGEYIDAYAETVDADEVATKNVRLRFPRALLEKYGDGEVAFSYKLKDLAGNETPDHARLVNFEVLLETAPADFLAPLVPANDDGLVNDTDARVPVEILIPPYTNVAAGDEIIVHWGTTDLAVAQVLPGEELNDPVKVIPITYAQLSAGSPGPVPASVSVTYSVKRGTITFPTSPATVVLVDLTIPGGTDPDPETPENENLKTPVVFGQSGTPNVITVSDYGQAATITIPWQTESNTAVFQANDRLRAYWGGIATPFLNIVITTPPTLDTDYTVPAATITSDATGDRPVWYTITRSLSTPPHDSTAKSKVQTVKVESNTGNPGDGNPLARPDYPEAKRSGTIYYIDRAAGLDGTVVRCPLTDTNIAAGDLISLIFTGYSSLDGTGTPVVTYPVANRQISGPEFAASEALIVIPTNIMRTICYGSATALYTVTNAQGSTVSTISEVVRIYLRNGSDASCSAPVF